MAFPFIWGKAARSGCYCRFMKSTVKIKENRDFRRAYNRGKSYVSPYIVVYVNKNRFGMRRLGITAGKKIGNAVCRNRAKRLIFAAFTACENEIPLGYDFVIVARTRILSAKSTDVARSLLKLIASAQLCNANGKNEKNTD